jgi:hypothetical protein
MTDMPSGQANIERQRAPSTVPAGLRNPMDEMVTFIHEAGHAVIQRVLGIPSDFVTGRTLLPELSQRGVMGYSTHYGHVRTLRSWWRQGKRRPLAMALRAHIIVSMAGLEAEIVCLGEAHPGDDADRARIAVRLDKLGLTGADKDTMGCPSATAYARAGD